MYQLSVYVLVLPDCLELKGLEDKPELRAIVIEQLSEIVREFNPGAVIIDRSCGGS